MFKRENGGCKKIFYSRGEERGGLLLSSEIFF
jgi:hypothetical protein